MTHERFIQTSLWCVPVDVVLNAEREANEQLTSRARIRTADAESEISVIHCETVKRPCPICGFAVSIRGARASAAHLKLKGYLCPCCGTKLQARVPIIAPPPFVWEAELPERLLAFIQECNRLGLSPTARHAPEEPNFQWVLPELAKRHTDAAIPDLDFRELEMKLVLYLDSLKEPYGTVQDPARTDPQG